MAGGKEGGDRPPAGLRAVVELLQRGEILLYASSTFFFFFLFLKLFLCIVLPYFGSFCFLGLAALRSVLETSTPPASEAISMRASNLLVEKSCFLV